MDGAPADQAGFVGGIEADLRDSNARSRCRAMSKENVGKCDVLL